VAGIISALIHSYSSEIFNLGNSQTVEFLDFVKALENALGYEIKDKELLPAQAGDVTVTHADISHAREKLGFDPRIKIEEGMTRFMEWYKEYYKKNYFIK
jgi:UDP-glucuronate 4-epimerase